MKLYLEKFRLVTWSGYYSLEGIDNFFSEYISFKIILVNDIFTLNSLVRETQVIIEWGTNQHNRILLTSIL